MNSTSPPSRAEPSATRLAREIDDFFMDMVTDQPAPGAVPAKPKLSAETAIRFMRDYESLVLDEDVEHTTWLVERAAAAERDTAFARIDGAIFADNTELSRIDLQRMCIEYEKVKHAADCALQKVQDLSDEIRTNRRLLHNLAIDILINRPADMPLPEPGANAHIVTDTPTLGGHITDIDLLVRAAGLNLSPL